MWSGRWIRSLTELQRMFHEERIQPWGLSQQTTRSMHERLRTRLELMT